MIGWVLRMLLFRVLIVVLVLVRVVAVVVFETAVGMPMHCRLRREWGRRWCRPEPAGP